MSDGRTQTFNEGWVSAAYHLFATGLTTPLGVDIAITNSGLNLPDAALDDLCNAITGDIGHPPEVHEHGIVAR